MNYLAHGKFLIIFFLFSFCILGCNFFFYKILFLLLHLEFFFSSRDEYQPSLTINKWQRESLQGLHQLLIWCMFLISSWGLVWKKENLKIGLTNNMSPNARGQIILFKTRIYLYDLLENQNIKILQAVSFKEAKDDKGRITLLKLF